MELVRNVFSWFFVPEMGRRIPSFRERMKEARATRNSRKLAVMNCFQTLASRDIGAPSPMDVYTELQHSGRYMKCRVIENLLASLVRQGMIQKIGRTNHYYALSDKGLNYLDTRSRQ